ncbi:MAG: prepilin-type N-terminal cleavage/methylation domain-containing protein [Betaproteobacteria bacterium]|nr:prepilin-type N-terminal cleavage/methylation domain-containing protein [Betaproteobacteria bacterium]
MRQQGFTLVELLIALALMAVLGVLSWRGLDTLVRTRENTQLRIDTVALAQTSLAQWRADLEAMSPMPGILNDSAIDWDGRVLRVWRRNGTPTAQGQDSGMQVVAWTVRDGHWWRWQSAPCFTRASLSQAWDLAQQWGQNPSDESRNRAVQLMPAQSWQLFYFRENAWTNPLSSAGNSPVTLKSPDGVRMLLQLAAPLDSGTLSVDWVRPSFNPGRS